MNSRRADLVGLRFGALTVLSYSHTRIKKAYWLCHCACGGKSTVPSGGLKSGHTKSCGCQKNVGRPRHGHSRVGALTSTYRTWLGMKERCANAHHEQYRNYGGRGIRVCARWARFENFLTDMGEKPRGLTLDRVDVNGNYEPGNCRWATLIEQAHNKRNNVLVVFRGESKPMAAWCSALGLRPGLVRQRLERGWTVADALTKPVDRAAGRFPRRLLPEQP